MSYLDELNDVQREAVTNIKGPVLVIAGPGSGKTRVLTYRIAYLLESGAAPHEILALTFTNKAAREMKERIAKVVGDAANRVWAGTFHSIFARILRVEAEKIGYPSNFTIYDTQDSQSVISTIVREQNLDKDVYKANAVLNRISSAKSNLITPTLYAQDATLTEQDRVMKRPHLHKVYALYVARCKRAGAMDFDDLLYQMFYLLQKNPDDVREKYRSRFKYLLVDEFQDTNYLQYAIIRKLINYQGSHNNICVVGDDAQSIYAFRGATIQNILDFEKDYPDLKTFKLEQNYRSTNYIVKAANEVIMHNKRQIQKEIWSNKGDGEKINVIKALTDNEEGKRIADTILEQKTRYHLFNKEIAILYRTNSQSRIFEEYLRKYNIAYRVYGGMSFYQRKEIKDFIAYLRLTVNPNDEEALRRVINFPKRGIGKTSVTKLSAVADEKGKTLWETALNCGAYNLGARATKPLIGFVYMMEKFQRNQQMSNAYEMAVDVAREAGLMKHFKADNSVEGLNRLENVNALLDGIKDFVENDEVEEGAAITDKSLGSYLQNIALLTDHDKETDDNDKVVLMSVHSAKGLEFKSVFVVGLEEKLFPSFMAMQNLDGLDEERRLFYVAITRAEQFLTLSYACSRYRFGNMQYHDASRFIEEISAENMRDFVVTSKSSVSGAKLKRRGSLSQAVKLKAPEDFKPSPSSAIQVGMTVLHLRFGEGKVLTVDGSVGNRVATIFFQSTKEQKRIMLKYAKLQIL